MLYLQVLEEEQNKVLNATTESFRSESTIPSVDSLDAFSHSSQVELLKARAADWWSQYIQHNPNVLTKVFYGEMTTLIQCSRCYKTRINYSAFNTLYVPIPRSRVQITVNVIVEYTKRSSSRLVPHFEVITVDVVVPQDCLLQQVRERVLHSLVLAGTAQRCDLLFLKGSLNPDTHSLDYRFLHAHTPLATALAASDASCLLAYLVPFFLLPSLHMPLLLAPASLRPRVAESNSVIDPNSVNHSNPMNDPPNTDRTFNLCAESIPILCIVFSSESTAITARRCARVLAGLYAPNEAAGVKTSRASEKRPLKVNVEALASSEIFGGEVGDGETPLESRTVALVHPFGETTMTASQILSLPKMDMHDYHIDSFPPTDCSVAVLAHLKDSLQCPDVLSVMSVINVMAIASEEDSAGTLKSIDATDTQKNIQKNVGVELATMRKKSLSFPRDLPIRLEDCLDFCTVVESSEVCSFCHHGGMEDLDQRMTILPPILVFLLKRFSYNTSSEGRSPVAGYRSKITDFVEFPLEGLDLSGYSLSPLPATYDLICVCNHSGTADFGHYYTYCRERAGPGWKWFEYNDEYVREMRTTEVQTANAYILFYRRHDLMVKELGSEGVMEMEARALQEEEDLEMAKREQEWEEREWEKRRNLALSIDLSLQQTEESNRRFQRQYTVCMVFLTICLVFVLLFLAVALVFYFM